MKIKRWLLAAILMDEHRTAGWEGKEKHRMDRVGMEYLGWEWST